MILICDICGGKLSMDQSGEFAVCENCEMKYTLDRLKAKFQEDTRTVKNYNSNEIEEQISNWEKLADDAYRNSNFSEAYTFYCKILEKNAKHWFATYRKGMCIGWQTNLETIKANVVIGGINDATELLCANEIKSDASKAYGLYTMALEFYNWINAVNNLLIDDYNSRYSFKNDNEWINFCNKECAICSLLKYSIMDTITEFMYVNCKDKQAVENLAKKVCGLGRKIEKSIKTPLRFKLRDEWDSFLKKYNTVYGDISHTDKAENAGKELHTLVKQFEELFFTWKTNYEQKVAEQLRKEKEERIEKYWSEHIDEKQKFEERISEIDIELASQRALIKNYDSRVAEIKKELSESLPDESKLNELKSKQSDLMSQKSKLGLFAGKQKKELQSQIDTLQLRINDLEEKIECQKNARIENVYSRVCVVDCERKPIADRIDILNEEKKQIINELSKDR